jgi:hypothetical protein
MAAAKKTPKIFRALACGEHSGTSNQGRRKGKRD